MNQRIAILAIIFLMLPYAAHSISAFTVQETEKIRLGANATDPDADNISTTYSQPLNDNGEWQTSYGDAGEYKVTITVSDGVTSDSKDVLIIVDKKEEAPAIDSFVPRESSLQIREGQSIDFGVLASDLNKDELSYEWFLDDEKINEGREFSYITTYDDAGRHNIKAVVSDGTASADREWDVNVRNADVEGLLDSINDIDANENEIVRLNLPNFEEYGLAYSISEPIGNDNEWQTTHLDSGSYEVKVHAEGKGFSGDKTVQIEINDVDRPPLFEKIGNMVINENEEIKIELNAYDPDDDEIAYSADNLPEGAGLEGNIFTWKTSHDTVKKDGFIDTIMEKFRVLSKSFHPQFIASSKDKKIVQNVIITVKNVNRAPILEEMEPITVNEGDTLRIAPKAYDLDGDKIKLKYSGLMSSDTFKSGFDDAGAYNVKVTASDGLLEDSKFVQVEIRQSNRAPVFGKVQKIAAKEGDNIAILLDAKDPDGDEITYSADNPPEGSSLKGNAFLWAPSYNTSSKKETKKFDLVFAASDGKSETRQIASIEVADKNRPPRVINSTKTVSAKVNQPVAMFVNAVDDDGDELTYEWKFGFLEKYKATPSHKRIFKSKGVKTVKVVVSDGTGKAEQVINVNVV